MTIDHLAAGQRFCVLREFTDAHGFCHRAGEEGSIQDLQLDWANQEIVICWEREGEAETMRFALGAADGPRQGRMREYFAELPARARSTAARGDSPMPSRRRGHPPVLPELVSEVVRDPRDRERALQRLWALAGRERFDEADEQLRILTEPADLPNDCLRQWAEALGKMAEAHAAAADWTVYAWLRDRATNLWYAWGSTATSGGEGASRAVVIDAAMDRFKALDQG